MSNQNNESNDITKKQMEKVLSKLSLYDILTTILTGYILCISVRQSFLSDVIPSVLFSVVASIPRKIAVAFIVGLVFHKIIEYFTQKSYTKCKCKCLIILSSLFTRNNLSIIKIAQEELKKEIPQAGNQISDLKDYYDAYYDLWAKNKLGVVTTIEAYSAFIKDLFFAFVIAIILMSAKIEWTLTLSSLAGVIVVFSIARYQCERKIYRLVLEGYYYEYI